MSIDKLLKEENMIVQCLSKYHCLKEEQLLQYIGHKEREQAQRILAGLKKKQYVLDSGNGYITLDPRSSEDRETIASFWVLLDFMKKGVRDEHHYPANYPSQIFFLKNNQQYEIVYVKKDNEFELKALSLENRDNSKDEEDTVKYIVIVEDETMIDECSKMLPNATMVFAIIDYSKEVPEIGFYK